MTWHCHFLLVTWDPLARKREGSAEGAIYSVAQSKCGWSISPKWLLVAATLGSGAVFSWCRTRFEGTDIGAP
jgi:hypothetical protein